VLPLVLAGIIVFLISFISKDQMIRHLVALVLSVVFFLVLSASLHLPEKKAQTDVVSVFLGALAGVIRAWLVIGFVVLYLRYFKIFDVSSIIGNSFYTALVKPIEWLLFFSFLR
jgi:NhaP-type Na+/H+ or K+/H+ antiporter